MTESDDPLQREADLDLREHDREVLDFLSQNPSSLMGFQGLRRQLGIHPEQLSRALRRLAVDGLVEQTELGYRVTQRALNLLHPAAMEEDRTGVVVIQASMPGDVDARNLITEPVNSLDPISGQTHSEQDVFFQKVKAQ